MRSVHLCRKAQLQRCGRVPRKSVICRRPSENNLPEKRVDEGRWVLHAKLQAKVNSWLPSLRHVCHLNCYKTTLHEASHVPGSNGCST